MASPDPEIESLTDFDRLIESGRPLSGCRVRSVDLTDRTFALLGTDTSGAVFLGCAMDPDAAARVRAAGALVLPPDPELPFDPFRRHLYSPDELYAAPRPPALSDGLPGPAEDPAAGTYEATVDARTGDWLVRTRGVRDPVPGILRALHDAAITEALNAQINGGRVVGVLGSHLLRRGAPGYAAAASLGRELARAGLVVATGGGPGAMEAANLGARLAPLPDEALPEALAALAAAGGADHRESVTDWARGAFAVRERFPGGGPSLGVPAWDRPGEPPNAFASHHARYFRSAVREDALPIRARGGLVFLPGAADTVQALFSAVVPNYHLDEGETVPIVLVDSAHWTGAVPAWPLLEALAGGRRMAERVFLTETVEEAARLLAGRR